MEEVRAATRRAWLEVDVAALGRNAAALAARIPGGRLLPMVKADGYGLGGLRVVRALRAVEPWAYGVASAEEGSELRGAGMNERIVVFFPCVALDLPVLVRRGLEPVVSSLDAFRSYAAHAEASGPSGGALSLHLEVDTGMGRSGLDGREAAAWAPEVATLLEAGGLRLASTFTHFHSAEDDAEATRAQWESFRHAVDRLRAAGVDPGAVHAANSAALVRGPIGETDVARPGLFLYGGTGDGARIGGAPPIEPGALQPEPVARLRARVLDVREVPEGTTVSYGATWTAARPSRLATLGIGYGDGLPHALSNRGVAILGGRRVPYAGRVCMDVTVVDVTEGPEVRAGDVATLLGRDGDEEIGLSEMASLCGTIEYELLTGFSARLPRVEVRSPDRPAGKEGAGSGTRDAEVAGVGE